MLRRTEFFFFFFLNDPAPPEFSPLPLPAALPISVQIGRTHGVHAEPITFGLKLAIWYEEAGRNLTRLGAAAEDVRVGKTSGAVGTFGHIEDRKSTRLNSSH